ncbi:unnamed protein product [Schistosoma rodhaini]|nr:unnamed protein product [Schistosoma rodhaini]
MDITVNVPPDSTNGKLENVTSKTFEKNCTDSHHNNNSLPTSSTACKTHLFQGVYLPDDDGSILTPEHAFVQYQTRSEDQACQICGQPAVGFHHRAYVCEACKKFFMRHTAARLRNSEIGSTVSESICPMGGRCRVEGPGRGKCPHCRYRKCLELGMTLTPPGGEAGCDISQIPCRVCSGPSSGFHFGALTCEGCKGFFRRTVLSNVRLECLGNNDCPITPANRNMCKSCRFQRCLAVGMSKTGSRIGRQPNAIKYYCAREISQLTNSNDCEATTTMNPSSSSSNKHESNRRNSISHSSTSSGTTNLSCNIGNNGNKNNNITTNHDDNNHNSSKNNNLNENDLLSIAEEHCRSVLGQSNYPSSSWPSFKRMMSNLDHLDSINSTTIANTATVSITTTTTVTTTTTIISTTGVSLLPSSIPLTSTSTINPFIERNNHNYNELHNTVDSLKNGSLLSLSPSSSTSPSSGIKSHIKYKTDTRPQYLNSQSRPFHHHPPPSPQSTQNNCFNNNNIGISGSNNNTANGVVLLSGREDSILPSSTSNGASHGSDYFLIDPSRNITKRRKTISSEMDVNLEISDNSITSSKVTPINSVHIRDDDDDVDDEGCDHDDIDYVNDNVDGVGNESSASGSNANKHLNQRYSHRHEQQHHPIQRPVHHRHQQQQQQQQHHNTDLTRLNEENIYNVIGSVNNDLNIGNSCRSNNNNGSIINRRYEKLTDSGKIHNISVDNFSFINQSRHLSNQINLPNNNEQNINNSNNNNDCSNVLNQLQFKNYPLMDRSSVLIENQSKDSHTVTTHLNQSYLRPTQLNLTTARQLSNESYSLSYLSSSLSSSSSSPTLSSTLTTTSCPRSSVISDYSEFNHQLPADVSDNNNNNNQIWLPKQRYIKSSRSLPNEQTNNHLISSNNANNNQNANNSLDSNSLGFLNGGRNVVDLTGLNVSEPTSTTTTPWFAAAAAAVAVVMAASQSSSSSSTNSTLLDPYTVSSNLNECFGINDHNSNNNNNSPSINQVNNRRVPVNTTNFSKQRFKLGLHETALDHQHSGRSFLSNSYNINPYDTTTNTNSGNMNENVLKIGKYESNDTLRSLHPSLSSSSTSSVASSLSDVTHPSTIAAMQAAAVAAAAAATAAGLVLSNSRVRGLSDEIYPNLNRVSISNSLPELPNNCYTSTTSSSLSSSSSPPIMGNFGRIIENLSMYSTSLDRNAQPISNLDYPSSSTLSSSSSLLLSSTVNNFPVNHSIVNTTLPSITVPVINNKEISPRLKNGTRPTSITVQQFAERIHIAAKYMITERKNIRSNLPQPCRLIQTSDCVEDIWGQMMKHFETHSRFIVQFVKYIPGFCYLKISDQRQLVRSAMYPIMLLELSRDYVNEDRTRYNYFDFTPEEHAIILSHFPTFHKISGHLIRSGEFLTRLNLDNIELTLMCAQEVFKDRQGLDDPVTPAYLFNLVGQALTEHIISVGYSLEERYAALSLISPMLEELNIEHHEVIAQLRQDRPDLEFPQLYLEMFQLTDEEQRDLKCTNYDESDDNQ